MRISYLDTWKGMEEAVRLGLAKSIGVSNFNEKQIQEIYENAVIKPVVNQVEVRPTVEIHAGTYLVQTTVQCLSNK